MKNQKEYILIGGYPDKETEWHPGGQITATRLLVDYAKANSIKIHIVDTSQIISPPTPIKKRFVKSLKRIQYLLQLLKRKNIIGTIIFSSSGLSFYERTLMCLLSKMHNIKSFLFIRSGHFIDLNEKSTIARVVNKVLLKIPTYIGAQGNKWLNFYSEMDVDLSKIKLIHNWIKINHNFSYNTNKEPVIFLFVGLMDEKKGILDLFDIIEEYDELDQYVFRFAGEGILFDELRVRKKKNKLNNIEFLGWVEGKKLLNEYKKADVFILPSYTEGFPNAVLEALNFRLPIISTNIGGIPDSVIDNYNGYIFEPGDKICMVESVKKLGESIEKRIKFSENGKSILIKNHDFNKNCQLVFNSFEN